MLIGLLAIVLLMATGLWFLTLLVSTVRGHSGNDIRLDDINAFIRFALWPLAGVTFALVVLPFNTTLLIHISTAIVEFIFLLWIPFNIFFWLQTDPIHSHYGM